MLCTVASKGRRRERSCAQGVCNTHQAESQARAPKPSQPADQPSRRLPYFRGVEESRTRLLRDWGTPFPFQFCQFLPFLPFLQLHCTARKNPRAPETPTTPVNAHKRLVYSTRTSWIVHYCMHLCVFTVAVIEYKYSTLQYRYSNSPLSLCLSVSFSFQIETKIKTQNTRPFHFSTSSFLSQSRHCR